MGKVSEIRMQIVKNLGNYETIRLEIAMTLDASDDLQESFIAAREELEKAFSASCAKSEARDGIRQSVEKELLSLESKNLTRICQALRTGRQTFDDLKRYYNISESVEAYLIEEKLI